MCTIIKNIKSNIKNFKNDYDYNDNPKVTPTKKKNETK